VRAAEGGASSTQHKAGGSWQVRTARLESRTCEVAHVEHHIDVRARQPRRAVPHVPGDVRHDRGRTGGNFVAEVPIDHELVGQLRRERARVRGGAEREQCRARVATHDLI